MQKAAFLFVHPNRRSEMLIYKKIRPLLDAENGGGGGAGEPPKDGNASGSGEEPKNFDEWLKGQPETVRALLEKHTSGLKSALDKEREAREKFEKAEKEAAKAREKAEQEALEKNQEFQKLAEQRAAKVAELEKAISELEPVKGNLERYQKALEAHLKAQREGLPAHIVALLDKLDVVEQLEWIAANREALAGDEKKSPPGVPPNPKSGGGKEPNPEDKQKAQERTGQLYRNLF
jgi:molecular chaperone GrpE (heat shock protein)